jgi:hypothetical protein
MCHGRSIFLPIWEPLCDRIPKKQLEISASPEGGHGDPVFRHAELCIELMKSLIAIFTLAFLFAAPVFAREDSVLARVTVYWRDGSSGNRASWNGARLRVGHCAVDPKRIPYGTKVVFTDATCVAVDTGPAVISRKAARLSGQTPRQREAIVVDRYFETREQALAWAETHPHFMTLRVVTDEPRAERPVVAANTKNAEQRSTITRPRAPRLTKIPPYLQQHPDRALAMSGIDPSLRCARRRTQADIGSLDLGRYFRYDDNFA